MDCARCGENNREGASFCAECGAPLAHRCTSCAAELRPTAKFCDECGTPVVPGRRHLLRIPSRRRVKPVTALFADLVGSTSSGERTDAEARGGSAARPFVDGVEHFLDDVRGAGNFVAIGDGGRTRV